MNPNSVSGVPLSYCRNFHVHLKFWRVFSYGSLFIVFLDSFENLWTSIASMGINLGKNLACNILSLLMLFLSCSGEEFTIGYVKLFIWGIGMLWYLRDDVSAWWNRKKVYKSFFSMFIDMEFSMHKFCSCLCNSFRTICSAFALSLDFCSKNSHLNKGYSWLLEYSWIFLGCSYRHWIVFSLILLFGKDL